MQDYSTYLQSMLVDESKAYGFTIGFWGSGMVLVMMEALNTFDNIFSFGLGAVIGFGVLSLIAFKSVLETAPVKQNEFLVLSTVHYFAALIPIAFTYGILTYVDGNLGLFLAGANVSITYNIFVLVQEIIAEELTEVDRAI